MGTLKSRLATNSALAARTLILAVVLSLCACGTSVTTATPARSPAQESSNAQPVMPIGHVGRWLTDAKGRVLLVHGVNMVAKHAPYYPAAFGFSSADASWLAANGFKIVRLGVLATGIMPTRGTINQSYINHIASTVNMLGAHGVFTLLDFHQDGWGPAVGSDGFPAWMTLTGSAVNNHVGFPLYYVQDPAVQQAFQSFWNNAKVPGGLGLQVYYAQMLSALAKTFAHSPYVVGYDLFNEPWPGTTWQPCITSSGCPQLDAKELAPLYARAVKAIRSQGDHHLIFEEPFVLFNFGISGAGISLPGNDPNSALSFHMYTSTPAREPDVLANAEAWAHRTGGALLNTEWGATSDPAAILRQTNELDSALLPWIFWSFNSWMVHSLALPPSGSNLINSTVSALVQPYPLLVTGTPKSFSYNSSTRIMSATWSTQRPGGGRYSYNTLSSIVVPSAVYPGGYRVTVSGAKVMSRPCAPSLLLANVKNATTVLVKVSPGSCS